MATYTPAVGDTIQSSTLEGFYVALLMWYQQQEADTVKNPSSLNYIRSTTTQDLPKRFAGTITAPVTVNDDGTIDVPEALTGITFVCNNADLVATSALEAIYRASVKIAGLELNTTANPSGTRYLSALTITMGAPGAGAPTGSNATLAVNFSQPVTVTMLAGNGGEQTVGAVYLN